MKIVKLEIEDDSLLSGVDAVALVETPAHEADFFAFKKQIDEGNKDVFYSLDWAQGSPAGLTDWLGEGPAGIRIIYSEEGNLDVYGYQTKYFDVCPGALATFEHLKSMNPDSETIGMIRSAAVVADQVFLAEKLAIANEKASPEDLIQAMALVADFKDIIHEIDEELGMVHDVDYMDGHIAVISEYVNEEEMANCVREMSEQHYFDNWPEDIRDRIIKSLADSGETVADYADWDQISEEEFKKELFAIVSSPNKESILDVGDIRIRYRYTGPRDSKNRSFCAELMKLTDQGKIFRKEDINQLTIKGENEQFGTYDIFTYKGSYNCRHSWEALYFRKSGDNGIKEGERPLAIGDLLSSPVNQPVIPNKSTGIQDKLNFARQALAEEQKVIGPLMRANKLIYRLDENNDPYYVYFTPNTIKRIAEKFMKEGRLASFNLEHDSNLPLEDVYITEAWLVEDPETDKSAMYGFKANKGDWYGITKIANKPIWNEFIKTGRVKGYSVEGFFMDQMFKQKEETFVKPSAGESENDFMQRCMPVVVGEGYDQDQAAAICYAYYRDR